MGKVAFVFAGQGDQYTGMGKALCDEYPEAADVFRFFERIRPGTRQQCFYGSHEKLMDTAVTQPCLFAVELAMAETLKARKIMPDAVAGFSLGEVAACTFAGIFSMEEGFRLIMERGRLMKEAADAVHSFMTAVLRLSREQLDEICAQIGDVYAVNFNCPGQITAAGRKSRQTAFENAVREMGGRAVPLKVSGAFHSPIMEPAAQRFGKALSLVTAASPWTAVYSNVTARPYDRPVQELLTRQIMHPVFWEETIRHMIRDGIDTFIEIGPGSTLTGMIRRIDASVRTYTAADIPRILDEVRIC